jgi:hypothetical protein
MKPIGSIAKLSIDFKAALADARRVEAEDRQLHDVEEALCRAQNIIDTIVAELRVQGLREPVGKLDTVELMQARLDAFRQRSAARRQSVVASDD